MKHFLIEGIGLGDGSGHISFNKIVTLALLVVFILTCIWSITRLQQVPPWHVWSFGVVVQGAGFGIKGYMAALEKRSEQYNAALNTNVNLTGDLAEIAKAVTARRTGDTEDTE
jgi:hypothetical protein